MNSMRPVPNVLQTAVFVLFIMFCITVIDRLLGYAIQSDDIGHFLELWPVALSRFVFPVYQEMHAYLFSICMLRVLPVLPSVE